MTHEEQRARILRILTAALGHDAAVEVLESYEAQLIEKYARSPLVLPGDWGRRPAS